MAGSFFSPPPLFFFFLYFFLFSCFASSIMLYYYYYYYLSMRKHFMQNEWNPNFRLFLASWTWPPRCSTCRSFSVSSRKSRECCSE